MDEKWKATHEQLRKQFNPDGSMKRRMQLRELEILKAVDEVCRRNHITYWLSSGTLLGAIRHDGFIPWDDDIDIELMRDEYLRLLPLLEKELPQQFRLQTKETDKGYFMPQARVCDMKSVTTPAFSGSKFFELKGLFIDIFSIEPQLTLTNKAGIWYQVVINRCNMFCAKRNWWLVRATGKAFLAARDAVVWPTLRFVSRLFGATKLMHSYGNKFPTPPRPADIFPLETHMFEDFEAPVPKNWDAMLRSIYGDYMQLPDPSHVHQHSVDVTFLDENEA